MKKLFIVVIFAFFALTTYAQIPYFAGTAGDGNIYGYTSLKFRPSINAQESYTTFQYGITDYAAAGTDIYSYNNSVYWGFLVRGGYRFNKWYGIGLQATPSFDMGNNFEFNYLTLGLYQNGSITSDGNLFWVSNTWAGINKNADNTWNQWWYLGYYVYLKDKGGITPMLGILHDWKFENKIDVAAGFYYTYKDWNFYMWGNNFFEENPRIVIGVDFKLKTKK
ncbi:MAG: hypothetical protein IJ413_00995 [Bacteroides sp.]|nr:hypothetical protein [Bacteroides sp.]